MIAVLKHNATSEQTQQLIGWLQRMGVDVHVSIGTSTAAAAAGADGIMVEVHNDPSCALCDGVQALTPAQFAELNQKIVRVREAIQ